jgi:hypothetical protein
MPDSCAISLACSGNTTLSRASAIIRAYARLLMSSEVQAK